MKEPLHESLMTVIIAAYLFDLMVWRVPIEKLIGVYRYDVLLGLFLLSVIGSFIVGIIASIVASRMGSDQTAWGMFFYQACQLFFLLMILHCVFRDGWPWPTLVDALKPAICRLMEGSP